MDNSVYRQSKLQTVTFGKCVPAGKAVFLYRWSCLKMSNMGSCGFTACKAMKARCDYCALGNNSVSLNSTQTSESEINPPIIK